MAHELEYHSETGFVPKQKQEEVDLKASVAVWHVRQYFKAQHQREKERMRGRNKNWVGGGQKGALGATLVLFQL
jgi:hypothetical protein